MLKHWRDNLKAMQGTKRGHRCFLIGNGPSLAHTPLGRMKDEYTFAMNKIADIYDSTDWRPTYYVCSGNSIIFKKHRPAGMRSILEPGVTSFVNHINLHTLGLREGSTMPEQCHPIRVKFSHSQPTYDEDTWSWDVSKWVSKDGSTMFAAMQIAVYMGFNPLYLVGCDLGHRAFAKDDPDPNHFSPDYWAGVYEQTEERAAHTEAHIVMGHKVAKAVCDKAGIEVYNATLGGELDIFPRVDLEVLLGI